MVFRRGVDLPRSAAAAWCLAVAVAAQTGVWEPAFNHPNGGVVGWPATFNAVHVALIPVGPDRGKVVVLDFNANQGSGPNWTQRWSVLDPGPMLDDPAAPTPVVVRNDLLPMPPGGGDLFCSGHAWTADGRLFVAGGTTQYVAGVHPYLGGYLTYRFDPRETGNAAWTRLPDLALARWYPSVTLRADGSLLVSGGTPVNGGTPHNNYETWDSAADEWSVAPGGLRSLAGPTYGNHGSYPRMIQLSTGDVFRAGQSQWASRLSSSGTWTTMGQSASYRTYGSAMLVPWATDVVWILGGYDGTGASLATVQQCAAGAASASGWAWSYAPAMTFPRSRQNAVLLPDGSIFVVGGRSSPNSVNPPVHVMQPETFRAGAWTVQPPHFSPREYHSTAVLLPDGRVLVGGGNTRTRDWEVFRPHYLTSGAPRPEIVSAPERIGYGETFVIGGGDERPVAAVLVRPASVTHHFDFDQRVVTLSCVIGPDGTLTATAPGAAAAAPPGHYMLFVLSAAGIPSVATWVHLS
jgi:hypothetical protein